MKSSFFNIYLRLEEGKGGYNKKKRKGEERMLDRKRMRTAMLIVMAFCLLCITSVVAGDREKKIDILFTHDVHSHLDCFKVKKSGEKTKTVGGFARMKTLIDEKRKEDPGLLLLDGGDFSMGTLYQTINRTEAAELTMMGRLGYDAVTFGNHEFDYRSNGLSEMLISAVKNKEEDASLTLPMLLSANIDWEKNKDQEDQKLREAMELYGAKPYTILERDGVKIGIYGVLGQEAEDFAPESGIDFDPIVDTSKKIVKELKDQGAEMIICLSHSGTNEDSSKSEDEELARKVPDIDVIISGHTHTKLEDYIKEGDTYIVSCGNYGEALGELRLKKSGDRWKAEKYQLNDLTDDVKEDPEITEMLGQYKKLVDEEYLSQFGYTFDQVLAENPVSFTQMDDFGKRVEEDTLGSLIADSYIYATAKAEGEDYEPVAAAYAPSGTIRDTLQKGEITVSDAFNVCSLGVGADGVAGYPLVSVYLTGEELKTAAEIDVSVSPIMTTAQLYPSGIRWTYNSNRLILNRVIDVRLNADVDTDGEELSGTIEDDKLYRVVAGLYSAQMLGTVEDTSMGLLKITPKDKDGNVIKDFEKHILYDQKGAEVKEWYALASYLSSFEKNEKQLPQISEKYEKTEGRKSDKDSKNIVELLKNPNKFTFVIVGIAGVVLLLLVFVVRFLVKCYTKKRVKKIKKDRR